MTSYDNCGKCKSRKSQHEKSENEDSKELLELIQNWASDFRRKSNFVLIDLFSNGLRSIVKKDISGL